MELKESIRKSIRQNNYRKRQAKKDIVRMELQVSKESKAIFDKIVAAKAEDYPAPFDKRRRFARARVEIFDNMMSETKQSFIEMSDRIDALLDEIKRLTPSFFKDKTPVKELPETIANLDDDPKLLKNNLAKLLSEKYELGEEIRKLKHICKMQKNQIEVQSYEIEALEDQKYTKHQVTNK